MKTVLTVDFRRPVPVFPLADCVLLPYSVLPLHVFEPRYCRMVQDCLDSFGLIGMGLFRGPVSRDEYLSGLPPLRRGVGLGYVIDYTRLEDGRYLVLLEGVCRTWLTQELPNEPYRLARLVPLDAVHERDDDLASQRLQVESLLSDPVFEDVPSVDPIRQALAPEIAAAAAFDMAISSVCPDAEQRYRMLCEPDAVVRAEWLIARLQSLRRVLHRIR